MTFFLAELRKWVKTDALRDTFQGYVFNDDSHAQKDGTFVTVEADDVVWHNEGCIVYCKKHIYNLWNTRKRGVE